VLARVWVVCCRQYRKSCLLAAAPDPQHQAAAVSEGTTAAVAEREQLLRTFVELLPPRAVAAHAEGVLARRHVEELPPRLLSQVPGQREGRARAGQAEPRTRCTQRDTRPAHT
jgi:hypothetical protein